MNKTLRFALPVMAVFCLLWACTKKIVLVSNIEYDVTTSYTDTGFVTEALATEIILTPEVKDYPGFEYHLKYELLSGEGYFVNEADEQLSEGTEEQLDATLDYTVNWKYIGTVPGTHRIKLLAKDNFEKEQTYELRYEVKPVAVIWTATTAVTQAKVNDTIPIILKLTKEPADFTTDFFYTMAAAEGSGTFLDATGTVLEKGAALVISEGETTIRFIPKAVGTARLDFTLSFYDTEQETALITIPIVAEDTNLAPVAVATIQNSGTNKGEAPFAVVFDGTGSTDDGTITNYQWDFGDGSPAVNEPIVNHTFTAVGEYLVTLQVTDDLGVLNTNTDTHTVRIFVEEIMQPDFMAIDDAFTIENTPDTTILVVANDQIPAGTTATISTSKQPVNGITTIAADGTLQYTANANFTGTDSFSYTITNEDGVASSAEVVLTVIITNELPTAVDDTAATEENTPVTIAVLANDRDPENKPLTITETTTPANGALLVNTNGTITYTPNNGFFGEDQFTYTINDGLDTNEATATVTITVNDVNQPPVGIEDMTETPGNIAVTIDVILNDTDPEGEILKLERIGIVPLNGTAVIKEGNILYTPNKGFVGNDVFRYVIKDEFGNENDTGKNGLVTVTVKEREVILIPDARFELALLDNAVDSDGEINGQIYRDDAENTITLNFNAPSCCSGDRSYFIKDITGLESFINLEVFSSSRNNFPPLDLSKSLKLKKLSIVEGGAKIVNINKNVAIEELTISSINQSVLNDLINLKELTLFSFVGNSIDLSKNLKLERLFIRFGDFSSLDLSMLSNLTSIEISFSSNLTFLNLKNNRNSIINFLKVTGTDLLTCITVDNVLDAEERTSKGEWEKDDNAIYSLNCPN